MHSLLRAQWCGRDGADPALQDRWPQPLRIHFNSTGREQTQIHSRCQTELCTKFRLSGKADTLFCGREFPGAQRWALALQGKHLCRQDQPQHREQPWHSTGEGTALPAAGLGTVGCRARLAMGSQGKTQCIPQGTAPEQLSKAAREGLARAKPHSSREQQQEDSGLCREQQGGRGALEMPS